MQKRQAQKIKDDPKKRSKVDHAGGELCNKQTNCQFVIY